MVDDEPPKSDSIDDVGVQPRIAEASTIASGVAFWPKVVVVVVASPAIAGVHGEHVTQNKLAITADRESLISDMTFTCGLTLEISRPARLEPNYVADSKRGRLD